MIEKTERLSCTHTPGHIALPQPQTPSTHRMWSVSFPPQPSYSAHYPVHWATCITAFRSAYEQLLLLHRGRGENPAELRNNPRTAAPPKSPEFRLETAPGTDSASVEQTRRSTGDANPQTAVFASSLVILCGSCQAWGTPACLELLRVSKLRAATDYHFSKRKAPSCGRHEPLLWQGATIRASHRDFKLAGERVTSTVGLCKYWNEKLCSLLFFFSK